MKNLPKRLELFFCQNVFAETSCSRVDYRTDGKRPDGVTMFSCELGEQLVRDVTVVAALAPQSPESRLFMHFFRRPFHTISGSYLCNFIKIVEK